LRSIAGSYCLDAAELDFFWSVGILKNTFPVKQLDSSFKKMHLGIKKQAQ
jgi:hypothetical protein